MAAMNTGMKNPHLATIIKTERKRRNLTQEHLAQLAEVDVRTVQRAERDGSCSSESLMAIAEALDRDAKDLITEAEELGRKQRSKPRPPKDMVVRVNEVTNSQELLASLRGNHASIAEFGINLDSRQLEKVSFVFDYLRDMIDVQSELTLSDRIRCAEEVGLKIRDLRSQGVICFSGGYTNHLVWKDKPEEPFPWNVQIFAFHRVDDSQILKDEDGNQFIRVVIPGENRRPTF